MKQVEFFFDFGSPAAYLAWTQVGKVAEAAGAELVMRPMLLGGVFKATGNASPVMVAAKGKWMMGDLQLWAKRYGVAFTLPPGFPLNTLYLMRGAVALEGTPEFSTYIAAVFDAMFGRGENMADPVVIGRVLTEAGLDAKAIIASTQDEAVKERLKASTEEAVKRGAFGAPTYFVGDQMFFGQDRLDFVAEALAR
ncbi:MAG: 2-hydroxychromene-2-carboxylate isomerase [Pikeienuella sp.]